ncbi:Thg1 polymerase-like protein [Helicosporidium sp. ATCC 50920]|nr:Thg1 polymerase-like protein [Helicosporidium sp. ATCC 50920]|eukprot:KDD75003.1 Thg1 polymerase-like protein [Helicosporidium sp. ATCC 50920]
MAKSAYEYVKAFEQDDTLLPECWIVVRLDGKGFTRFCSVHGFEKPNDLRGLSLMDDAALEVARLFPDIRVAYGESDEYSFVFHPGTVVYGRRASKLVSLVTSCFSASYVRLWPRRFGTLELRETPIFDGRAVCYPTLKSLRDYLSWRQVDTHVNNLYNTAFWALVQSGQTTVQAHDALKGTRSDVKNEILFSQFGINYNNLPERFRKGSVVIRAPVQALPAGEDGDAASEPRRTKKTSRVAYELQVVHVDIIKDAFWAAYPHLLATV